MHRVFAPLACRVILARGPRAAFKDSAQLSGTAPRRLRDSVTLTHPCQHAAAHLPCTRPPDALYACRPARPGARDRAGARAFVTPRAGTNTTARRGEEEDEIVAGTSFGAAGGTNTLGRASMRPQMLATPSAPDDLQAALSQQTSYDTKLFEVAILLTVVNACKPVKDAGDLLILRETLLEELGPAYMWLIFLSVVEWPCLPDADKQQHAQMRLD